MDLPCSPAILRLHTGGTNPGSISAHLPSRAPRFCLPLLKRGSTTSITFISGLFCRSLDSGLQPPCLRFAVTVADHHARLGTRLLAKLCRGRHLRPLDFRCFARRNKSEAGRLVRSHKVDPKPSTFRERMKIMLNHNLKLANSEQDPANSEQRTANSGTGKTTISNVLRRRARAVIRDKSIDAQSRALIRYALEINDPWLPELVRRADAGETIIHTVTSLKHPHPAMGNKRRKFKALQR